MPITWGLRVASSPRRGAGHVTRCIALAEALPGPSRFFLDPDDVWADRLTGRGHSVTLEADIGSADRMAASMRQGETAAAIVDSYDIDGDTGTALSRLGPVMKLDDGVGDVFGAAVLNAAVETDPRFDRLPAAARLFGPEFALLAPVFAQTNASEREAGDAKCPATAKRILIAMGARDSQNVTQLALQACEGLDAAVTVAIGAHADHIETVTKLVSKNPHWRLIVNAPSMTDLYVIHDLAIGAAGQSLFERMACGLPSLVVVQSDNQTKLAGAVAEAGACRLVGEAGGLTAKAIADAVRPLAENRADRLTIRRAGLSLIDGRGAERAARQLTELFGTDTTREISL